MSNKPIILGIEETKNKLASTINDAVNKEGIPCYFLESVLVDMLRQVQDRAREELHAAEQNYFQSMQEQQNSEVPTIEADVPAENQE